VHVFDGAATNFKVTFLHDVDIAARLLRERFSGDDAPR
jgi:2-C-methyl-D-erythritol 4-phosphate cytidylyltransferase